MKEKLKIYFIFLRYIWKESKLFFILKLIQSLVAGIAPVLVVVMSKYIMDILTINKDFNLFILFLVFQIFIYFILQLIGNVSEYFINIILEKINISISEDMLNKIYNMSFKFYDVNESYNIINRAFNYATSNGSQMLTAILNVFTNLITVGSYLIILGSFSIHIVIVLIIANVTEFYLKKKAQEFQYQYRKDITGINRKANHFKDLILNKEFAKEIKINTSIYCIFKKFKETKYTLIESLKKFNKKQTIFTLSIELTNHSILFFSSLIIGIKFLQDLVTLGDFTMVLNTSTQFTQVVMSLIGAFGILYNNFLESKNYMEFLDLIKNSEGKENPFEKTEQCNIEFKNVYFKYPTQDNYIFEDFSLKIKSGDKIALIGDNGSGKSTITKLILKFYDIEKGEILINGININDINLVEYYKKIGVVFQDFRLIQGLSILENLTMFDEDFKDNKKLDELMLNFNLEKQKDNINKEYSKLFNNEGIELSGGEVQKLTLLRAILKESNLLILDESSSALDVVSENIFFKNILQNNNKTAIIVSHRLAIAKNCDYIIFLRNGKIIESGTHNELIKRESYYNNFLKLQNNIGSNL